VHEEHARVGAGGDRLGQDRAVHVGVPARFEHQRPPDVVGVFLHPRPLLEHGAALRGRIPFQDEPEGFAGGMGVERAVAADRVWLRHGTSLESGGWQL